MLEVGFKSRQELTARRGWLKYEAVVEGFPRPWIEVYSGSGVATGRLGGRVPPTLAKDHFLVVPKSDEIFFFFFGGGYPSQPFNYLSTTYYL